MRPRRFDVGDAFIVGNVNFRVVQGEKHPDDLRLDWYIGERWQPVTLDAIFLIVDMVAENEDVLFPYPARGGEEVVRYVRLARQKGWRHAVELLQRSRKDKQERLAGDAA